METAAHRLAGRKRNRRFPGGIVLLEGVAVATSGWRFGRKRARMRAAARFDRLARMKTNGPGPAVDAFTYVSRDLRGVSSLNLHPSARENIARLMICLTRGRGCWLAGWRAWRREPPEETPTAGIALLLFTLPRPLPRPSCILVNHFPRIQQHLAPSLGA